MSNAATTSATSPCCPLVWGAAYTVYQTGMPSQPMQMVMYAPMSAPVMMPLQDGTLDSFGYNAMAPNSGSAPNFAAWTPEGQWQSYLGAPFYGEQAPRQLPMDSIALHEVPTEAEVGQTACHWAEYQNTWQEDVPTQFQMDSAELQPQMQKNVAEGAGSLRRRRCQEAQQSDSARADMLNLDDECANLDTQREPYDPRAMEIASRLIEQFNAGGDLQQAGLASFEDLAFTSKITSQAAQMILAESSIADAAAFAAGLRGHIWSAVQSKHANHVVQKIIEVMPPGPRASFVIEELKGFGQELVRHSFGCRVVCRILEHLSPGDSITIDFLDEVFADPISLCSHPFANFPVRHLLEFGLPEHRHRVVAALQSDIFAHAKHKFASLVVEQALRHASPDDQMVLAKELLGNRQALQVLAANQFGRHVCRALFATQGSLKKEVVDVFRSMEDQLKTRYGKSVLQELRKWT